MSALRKMIVDVKAERRWFFERKLFIEAAACAIRQIALEQALRAVEDELRSQT